MWLDQEMTTMEKLTPTTVPSPDFCFPRGYNKGGMVVNTKIYLIGIIGVLNLKLCVVNTNM